MTERQKRFADEYVIDLNATRAYKAAYPNIKSDEVAASCGARLLRNAKVGEYVEQHLAAIKSRKVADAQEVTEYLSAVLRGKTKSSVVVVESVGGGISTAKLIKKPPDERERLKAAELLGKRYSLFTDKVNVEGVQVVFMGGEKLED